MIYTTDLFKNIKSFKNENATSGCCSEMQTSGIIFIGGVIIRQSC